MMFLSLFGSEPGRHPAYRTVKPYLFSIFLERFAPLLQGLVQGEFAVVRLADGIHGDRVRVRRVRQIREVGVHVFGRLGDDGVGLLPSEEIIGLGRGSPSVDFSGGMPSCARFTFTPSPCANV